MPPLLEKAIRFCSTSCPTVRWRPIRPFRKTGKAYFTSALLYFIICFPLARLARYLEIRSMRMPAPKKILFEEEGTC